MYLPRLGAWRGWQIPHDEFAKCLLAASGFRAPWSNEKDKTQGLPARRAPASEVRGALVWPLTCKCCSQRLIPPPPSPSSPDPASIPLSTQSPGPGGLHNLPLRIPPTPGYRGESRISYVVKLFCFGPWLWTGKFSLSHVVGVVSLECTPVLDVDMGPVKVSEMKKNTKWLLIWFDVTWETESYLPTCMCIYRIWC